MMGSAPSIAEVSVIPSAQNIRGGRLPTTAGDAAPKFRVELPIDGLT